MMPKLVNRTPSYRLHKATRQAVVTLNGRDYYLGEHGSQVSRSAYDRLISEWLAHGRRLPPSRDDPDYTVTEVVAAYWQHAERYYHRNGEPTSELAYLRESLRVLKRLYGDTLLTPVFVKQTTDVFRSTGT